jgi:hypothetical protein
MTATPSLTIGVDRYRNKEGLVQAHLQLLSLVQMVVGRYSNSDSRETRAACIRRALKYADMFSLERR